VTIAVCLRCGEFKHGAFTTCSKCDYLPDDDESLTKHLLVSDHFHTEETLKAIAARIKSGEPVTFDPESLQAAWVSKAALDRDMKRLGRGCWIVFGVLLLLVVAVIAGLLAWGR
jgi:hypothetical protein